MNADAPLRLALKGAVVGVALLVSASASAKTTGVGDDPLLQTGPCYEALVEKNESNPTTAPNRELGAACEAENGDIDKAWARVVRLWGSDSTDLPDYDSYRRADAPNDGAAPTWLALVGVLLTYVVLGAPMRSAACLMGAYPGRAREAVVDVVASLVLRALIAGLFVALFRLPYFGVLGAVALIVLVASHLGRAPRAPLEASSGSLSAHLAEILNDAAGGAAGLAAVALFARNSYGIFAFALALALVVSIGPIVVARRAWRATRLRAAVAAAALAAALGEALIALPPASAWLGGLTGAALIAPLALAGLTLAAGLGLARPNRPANESLRPGG